MSSVACDGTMLASLQNVFSASIGVAIAYPILSQIIDIKNQKALKECRRVLSFTKRHHGESGFNDLGNEQLEYQFEIHRISKVDGKLTLLSALIGFIAFFSLAFSALNPSICTSYTTAYFLCNFILCTVYSWISSIDAVV
jgi:hypothetical protein